MYAITINRENQFTKNNIDTNPSEIITFSQEVIIKWSNTTTLINLLVRLIKSKKVKLFIRKYYICKLSMLAVKKN
jgi:hypothetical protein